MAQNFERITGLEIISCSVEALVKVRFRADRRGS
jgi:hypothetical protein